MQREIKKKTLTYGFGALILALLLTTVIYNLGTQIDNQLYQTTSPENLSPPEATIPTEPTPEPEIEPEPEPEPTIPNETPTQPEPPAPPELSNLKTFTNQQELETFILENMEKAKEFQFIPQFSMVENGQRQTMEMDSQASALGETSDYSTTNIQVEGVDEADIIKSDGEYLYIVSGTNVYIVKAYPPDQAQIISRIELNETYTAEIYINENRLIIVESQNLFYMLGMPERIVADDSMAIWPYPYNENIFIKIYDVENKADPILVKTVNTNGTLSGSRMINDYVYMIVNQAIIQQRDPNDLNIDLPKIFGSHTREIQANEIRYVDFPDSSYQLTTIIAINVKNEDQETTYEPFLAGQSTNIYVSENNMYLVVPNTNYWLLQETENDFRDQTLIYRIKLDQDKITTMAEGSVLGYVLNQFSMDEHNNFFRVATTEWKIDGSTNNLYILNMDMNTVGKIEDIAEGEQIYSARFIQDRGYLVTFRQVDPFYVIDLKDPTNPTILGYLKIPGFSGYLHPYDESHIIGIGKEDNNLKLSLFNVTDVSKPTENAKYQINSDWSDTTVLWDHKAFLFDKAKQLLALPVSINNYRTIDSQKYWQGAYIFNLTPQEGFTLQTTITHQKSDQYDYNTDIKRIQYIEQNIYTISNNLLKINNLETYDLIKQIELQ